LLRAIAMIRISKILATGTILTVAASAAWAGSYTKDGLTATCSAPDCLAASIAGEAQRNEPWVWQVSATAGECLRVHVTTAATDLEMALVSSDPAKAAGGVNFIWANDNNGADNKPLIKVDPVPVSGLYVIVVAAKGTASSNPFVLKYGRYQSGNGNCAGPTQPGA
jgi:hypothetical protein